MTKSAEIISKWGDQPTTIRKTHYNPRESQRSHITLRDRITFNRIFSLNRDDQEIRSIKTEPILDLESPCKSPIVIFDRNHKNIIGFVPTKKNIHLKGSPLRQSGEKLNPNQAPEINNSIHSGISSKSQFNCLICCDKPSNAVFMDCGHGGFCYECGMEILQKSEECHLCRTKIVQVLLLDLNSKSNGVLKVSEGAKLVSCSEFERSNNQSNP